MELTTRAFSAPVGSIARKPVKADIFILIHPSVEFPSLRAPLDPSVDKIRLSCQWSIDRTKKAGKFIHLIRQVFHLGPIPQTLHEFQRRPDPEKETPSLEGRL